MSPITRRWQRDLDQQAADIHETRLRDDSDVNGDADSRYANTRRQPIQRGMKVRLISDPDVLLTVREVDVYGRLDGTGKVLCFNAYGHGRWMRIDELEIV